MPKRIACGLFILGAVLATGPTAWAAGQPTFADLLARAQAEAEAGHRWGPPGDNLADTIMMLFQLAPTATPDQLAAFADLLERDRKNLQQSPVAAPSAPPAPTEAAPPPAAAPPKQPAPAVADIPPAAAPAPATETPPAAAPPHPEEPAVAALPPATAPPPAAIPPRQKEPAIVAPPLGAAPPPAAAAPPPRKEPAVVALPPAAAPPPAGAATALATPAPPHRLTPRPPDQHADELYARGKAAEAQGDISGARRFYAAAAARGHAAAARDLGRMYDPAVLDRITVGGIDPNPALARQWYQRAAELGDPDAKPLLQALMTTTR